MVLHSVQNVEYHISPCLQHHKAFIMKYLTHYVKFIPIEAECFILYLPKSVLKLILIAGRINHKLGSAVKNLHVP